MSKAKDTLLRLFALLRLIPTEPQRIATPTLLEKLRDKGFSVTLRSIQRDLNRLSIPFSLQCNDSEIPFRWSFTRDAPLKLEDMDAPTALALFLSESHLSPILPQSVLDQLSPQFRRARNFLSGLGGNGLADWAKRVRTLPNGKTLLPAQVSAHTWAQVSAGLLERKQLEVVNKIDLVSPERLEALQERAKADGRQVYFVSARDNLGLEPLVEELWRVCESTARNEPIVRLEGPSIVEEEEFPEIEVIYTKE